MPPLFVKRLFFCAIVLASASEQHQLRADTLAESEACCWSEGATKSKHTSIDLNCALVDWPSALILDDFNCLLPADIKLLSIESVAPCYSFLRGPPRLSHS